MKYPRLIRLSPDEFADAEIFDALRAYAREHGRPPTCTVVRREHRRPGASVIIRRHGSWSAAIAAALGTGAPESS
jgi:hypothetical protein